MQPTNQKVEKTRPNNKNNISRGGAKVKQINKQAKR